MIQRWVANAEIKEVPVVLSDLHNSISEFNQHFPKDANRIEMSNNRWNNIQSHSPVPATSLKDAENRLGVEIVIDHEIRDDLMRIVSEWRYE